VLSDRFVEHICEERRTRYSKEERLARRSQAASVDRVDDDLANSLTLSRRESRKHLVRLLQQLSPHGVKNETRWDRRA
jgi:hypothetical protein